MLCSQQYEHNSKFENPDVVLEHELQRELGGARTADLLERIEAAGLAAGFWTPLVGVITACAEASVAFSSPAHPGIPAALAVLGLTLALIGPGQWSVDARLYGRKHFVPPAL